MNLNEKWQEILKIIEKNTSETTFNLYFARTVQPIEIVNNELYLLISSEFNKNSIEKSYYDILIGSVKKVLGANIETKMILDKREIIKNSDYSEDTSVNKSESASESNSNEHSKNSNTKFNIAHINGTLNPKYVFEEFVIGANNQFAYAAAESVAKSSGKTYNPLFLYGDVGLGKTHLMQAIGNYMISLNPDAKVAYLTSEKFMNDFINSIRDNKNEEFRNKYRTVDILLVDDIQFFVNKKETQEEFFHTFNALYEANKKIVLSSDRPPKEINPLEDRLKSRFEQGLVVDIYAPDYETRIAILRKKLVSENKEMDDEVLEYIAKNIKSNIRKLEGALNKVIAFSEMMNMKINLNLAVKALYDTIKPDEPKTIDASLIKKAVSTYYRVRYEDLSSNNKSRNIAYPRQISMYLCRELTELSFPEIGKEFGGKDHSTIIHACNKITKDMETNADFKNKIDKLIEDIKNS